MAWCVVDSWNHDVSEQLYRMSEVKGLDADRGVIEAVSEPFHYTFTLAFLQFAFMAFVFCAIYAAMATSSNTAHEDFANLRATCTNGRWPALVGTHVFSSFLLQSLMMPTQMMSLGFFAATRAVEIPVAAGMRGNIFGNLSNGPSMRTTFLMAAAAWLLFYSYTQIAECLCVWSGFGVALSGLPLLVVYAMLLTVPACNVVLQESVLVQMKVSPVFMLALQNVIGALAFSPLLLAVHFFGLEDVLQAMAMITSHREVYMTVLWLCVQNTVLSVITVGLICTLDSFWTVSARCLRVVFWWARELIVFYFTSNTLLSVARPHASLWSFIMLCGVCIGCTAFYSDTRSLTGKGENEHSLIAAGSSMLQGCGTFKHV
jgi:hypothetical protein